MPTRPPPSAPRAVCCASSFWLHLRIGSEDIEASAGPATASLAKLFRARIDPATRQNR